MNCSAESPLQSVCSPNPAVAPFANAGRDMAPSALNTVLLGGQNASRSFFGKHSSFQKCESSLHCQPPSVVRSTIRTCKLGGLSSICLHLSSPNTSRHWLCAALSICVMSERFQPIRHGKLTQSTPSEAIFLKASVLGERLFASSANCHTSVTFLPRSRTPENSGSPTN